MSMIYFCTYIIYIIYIFPIGYCLLAIKDQIYDRVRIGGMFVTYLASLAICAGFGAAMRFKTHFRILRFRRVCFTCVTLLAEMCVYIYMYTQMFNILHPIWKYTHKGSPPPHPMPSPAPLRTAPALGGLGWGGIPYGYFPISDIGYWILDICI